MKMRVFAVKWLRCGSPFLRTEAPRGEKNREVGGVHEIVAVEIGSAAAPATQENREVCRIGVAVVVEVRRTCGAEGGRLTHAKAVPLGIATVGINVAHLRAARRVGAIWSWMHFVAIAARGVSATSAVCNGRARTKVIPLVVAAEWVSGTDEIATGGIRAVGSAVRFVARQRIGITAARTVGDRCVGAERIPPRVATEWIGSAHTLATDCIVTERRVVHDVARTSLGIATVGTECDGCADADAVPPGVAAEWIGSTHSSTARCVVA